jgi:hypothetical protein
VTENQLRQAFRILGSRGGKAPKTITPEDRQRRRDWARGLAAIRSAKKAAKLSRFLVLDRQGKRWPYHAETLQAALARAKSEGVDAVGGKAEAAR